ncbi:DUF3054 domain-containing protein [Agrococcus beijingensis]|uniref:DUF3054 domain-containing protein n=1 Tax=Agrococcus beijingensis TaxID=3068634 RepID=UPI0027406FF3|nr:DUF3054 domain-containing protein [Agrococcus sp. REN33]
MRTTRPDASARLSRARVGGAIAVDAVAVIAFAAIGRATHDGDVLGSWGLGLATTAWPFLVALAIGWLACRGWRAPLAPLRTGVSIWLVTVVGGMLLRVLSGQGTAAPFVIVATLTLLLLLVGWRLVARLVVRRASTRVSRPTRS